MTSLGVFRDDYYNASAVLPQANAVLIATALSATLLSATTLAGAQDQYVQISGQTSAQTATTDSAVNIIAQLQQAVAVAYKNQIAGFGQSVNPPNGVPNLFNFSYTLTLANANATAGTLTLTAGAGVTVTGTRLDSTATPLVVVFGTAAIFVVTVTSPTTITMVRVQ